MTDKVRIECSSCERQAEFFKSCYACGEPTCRSCLHTADVNAAGYPPPKICPTCAPGWQL